jgi:U3 small nucleolar RNA-associated protein 22
MLAFYRRTYIHAPRHHRAIAALVHRFGAFGGTVRLVQRWIASHWLFSERNSTQGHVRAEALELLVAYVFLVACGGRDNAPATKELGFFRVVAFLAGWEWEKGLYVPLYEGNADNGLSSDSITAHDADGKNGNETAKNAVNLKAGSARSGAWTLVTKEDLEGRMWTEGGPTALVARRIKSVASVTMKCVDTSEKEGHGVNPRVNNAFL